MYDKRDNDNENDYNNEGHDNEAQREEDIPNMNDASPAGSISSHVETEDFIISLRLLHFVTNTDQPETHNSYASKNKNDMQSEQEQDPPQHKDYEEDD